MEPRSDERQSTVGYFLGAYLLHYQDLDAEIEEFVLTESTDQAASTLAAIRSLLADQTITDDELGEVLEIANWTSSTPRATLEQIAERLERCLTTHRSN